MPTSFKKIAITLGDPCSIGAEITRKALENLRLPTKNFIIIGNKKAFGEIPDGVDFIDIEAQNKLKMGKNCAEGGRIAFESIQKAIELAKLGNINAIVTAPISKYALHLANYQYSGHTEILDKFLKRKDSQAEMLFAAKDLRVLLLTRHIPLTEVSLAISKDLIIRKINLLNDELNKLGIHNPKLALCGLNPHSGEEGLIGKEEQELFHPAIKTLQQEGINIEGPYPADTLFAKAAKSYHKGEKQPYDCYVSTFHDQGLCAIKSVDIDKTVNITLGLEVLRTSPAHGTAFDIAGKNIADSQSMEAAILTAYTFTHQKKDD